MERGKISPLQTAMLLMNTIISTSIIFLPGGTALRDAWLATIGGLIIATVITWVVATLGRFFPEQTIMEYAETIMGRYAGKFFVVLFLLFFTYLAALTLWDLGVFVEASLLEVTPLPVLNTVGIIVAIYTARQGIENIARVVQFFLPLLLLSLILAITLAATMPNNNFGNLLPVLDRGIKPVLAGSIGAADWLGETIFLAMLWPFINKKSAAWPAALASVVISGILLIMIAIVVVAVYSEYYTAMLYPFYSAIMLADIFGVVRLDILIVTAWIIGVFLKVSFLLYVISLGLARWLALAEYKPLIVPVAVIILGLANLPIIETTAQWSTVNKTFSTYALFMQLILPMFLMVIAYFRSKASG